MLCTPSLSRRQVRICFVIKVKQTRATKALIVKFHEVNMETKKMCANKVSVSSGNIMNPNKQTQIRIFNISSGFLPSGKNDIDVYGNRRGRQEK